MLVERYVKRHLRLVILLATIITAFLYYFITLKNSVPSSVSSVKTIKKNNVHSNFATKDRQEIRTSSKTYFNLKSDKVYRYRHKTAEVTLAVVLCGERFKQTVVSLKSVVVFSQKELHFVIIVDDNNKESLQNELLEWPIEVLEHLSFEIHPISFPEGSSGDEWKNLFKLCAAQRLFLPSLLHQIDSLLYIDTDVIFMRPIEELWQYFYKMNGTQIAALCPEHEEFATGWYNRFARHPYYKPLGVNSGVMLMNLTRMRAFNWESYLPSIMKEYKSNIVWGDQDVINIIFHYHPDKLLIFPCEWNYRPDHCMYSSICKTVQNNGVGVIHGNRGVFKNSRQPAFRTVYEHMVKFNIGDDIKSNLIEPLKQSLGPSATNCGKHLFHIMSSDKPVTA